MRYARNSSTFCSFDDTRQLFWKHLRLWGYPARFLLPVFREINYINTYKWFSKPRRLSRHRTVVFKSTYTCSYVGIKKGILKHLLNLSLLLVINLPIHQHIYVSKCFFGAHGFKVNSVSPKIKHCTFAGFQLYPVCKSVGVFSCSYPSWNVICTLQHRYKISSFMYLVQTP